VNTFGRNLQLAALGDLDSLDRLVAGASCAVLDFLHNVVTLENFAKYDVLAVEPAAHVSASWLQFPFFNRVMTHLVIAVVIKNWEPLVSGPAFAMDRRPVLECLSLKFSSGNRSP